MDYTYLCQKEGHMNALKLYLVLGLSIATLTAPATAQATDYTGSSFNDVWNVITGADHFIPKDSEGRKEFSAYSSQRLPKYPVTSASIFSKDKSGLERDARRTLSEKFDYYDRLPKKLHPNGVCVAGEWTIFTPNDYTGYFANGSKGLFIGRVSVAMGETETDKARGFGIAGKLFPTLNADQVVKTGNFFTVDVLLGTKAPRVLEVKTTNQPAIGFDLSLFGLLIKISSALKVTGEDPTFRPLSDIANLKYDDSLMKQPKWIRLSANASHLKLNNEKDFRNEVLTALKENSEITYNIEVSNTTKDRLAKTGWIKLGEIKLTHAVASYGCDRRLHFAHPTIK